MKNFLSIAHDTEADPKVVVGGPGDRDADKDIQTLCAALVTIMRAVDKMPNVQLDSAGSLRLIIKLLESGFADASLNCNYKSPNEK